MKKIVFSLFLSIICLILISEKTFAAENPTNLKTLSENLTIEIYSDGRVAPIKDANKLTEEELNKVLVEIGYSENYINNINLATKQKLVSYGGKVVEGKIADMTHEYVSNDKSYEITPYNRDKIRDIQIADLKEANMDSNLIEAYVLPESPEGEFSIMSSDCLGSTGGCSEGKWSADIQTIKIGETSTQVEYLVQLSYHWSSWPVAGLAYGENAAMHWGSYGQPVDGTAYGEGANRIRTGVYEYMSLPLDLGSNYGLKTEFTVQNPYNVYDRHDGSIMEVIRISKDHKGDILTISGAYSHPWTANNWDISVGYGALSFSGSFGTGDKWTWRYNFTVQ